MYRLDWETTDVVLGMEPYRVGKKEYRPFPKGRFTHTLRRPTHDQIFEHDNALRIKAAAVSKLRSASRTEDPTTSANLRLYDEIVVSVSGYSLELGSFGRVRVPDDHKVAAVQKLYERVVYVSNDLWAEDEIVVIEESGKYAERPFQIKHVLREPTESELKLYYRQTRVARKSTLTCSMDLYESCLLRLEGAEGDPTLVDPIIQREVVSEMIEFLD